MFCKKNRFRFFKVVIMLVIILVVIDFSIRYGCTSKNCAINLKNKNRSKIFCMILTSPKNLNKKAVVVNRTWAQDCDKYVFVVKFKNNLYINESIELLDPLPLLQPSYYLNENYSDLTNKVYRAFQYIYLKYSNEYDWFLKADDDTFIFMDNLRTFLGRYESTEPIRFGYDFKESIVGVAYHSGGAGYVLSKEALKRLATKLIDNYTACDYTGTEDVDISRCLKSVNVSMLKSIDSNGRERFHPINVKKYLLNRMPSWIYEYSENVPKSGVDCCSNETISFHYMKADEILNLYSLWNGYRVIPPDEKNFTRLLYKFISRI